MDKIDETILRQLDMGQIPTYNRLGIERVEFQTRLEELESQGYLVFERLDHPVFQGEPGNIKITSLGKSYVEN